MGSPCTFHDRSENVAVPRAEEAERVYVGYVRTVYFYSFPAKERPHQSANRSQGPITPRYSTEASYHLDNLLRMAVRVCLRPTLVMVVDIQSRLSVTCPDGIHPNKKCPQGRQ